MLVANAILQVKSPAFLDKGQIPAKYTCTGDNINPEINISGIPRETRSLALIMDDPDAPGGTYVHWIMWNIPPKERIEENSTPGAQGMNSRQENKYYGPCPPSGTHHYHFRIYALDTLLDLPVKTDKAALMQAMNGHVLASRELVGLYKK